jgi:protein gp37
MENSKIEWCDHTINFWWGCQKVSPGCEHCYAETIDARFHLGETIRDGHGTIESLHWGPNAPHYLRAEAARREAIKYQRRAQARGCRYRIFVNSMGDFFEDRKDLRGPRLQALAIMAETPELDWMILTKRPENIKPLLQSAWEDAPIGLAGWLHRWAAGSPPSNVWLGTSAESQGHAETRIPPLLKFPAAVHFLSAEPLLAPLNLIRVAKEHAGGHPDWLNALTGEWVASETGCVVGETAPLDWVIVGGESGHEARPMDIRWVRAIRDDCARTQVPFFFKAWGEWVPAFGEAFWLPIQGCPTFPVRSSGSWTHSFDLGYGAAKVGRNKAVRLLDGVIHSAFPEVAHAAI